MTSLTRVHGARGLIAVLLAVVIGWLTMPMAAAAAPPEAAPVHAYAYDAPARSASTTEDVSERGPPATYDHALAYNAADNGSRGASARSGNATAPASYTYDDTAQSARTARGRWGAMGANGGGTARRGVAQRSDVAANGVSETAGGLTNLGRAGSRLNLGEFSSGQAFSGVYDDATGSILALPSTRASQLPANWVSARGGHAAVNARLSQALGTSAGGRSGFAAFLDDAGGLRVEWLSRSVNGAANPYVPEALRPSIMQALAAATGRSVY